MLAWLLVIAGVLLGGFGAYYLSGAARARHQDGSTKDSFGLDREKALCAVDIWLTDIAPQHAEKLQEKLPELFDREFTHDRLVTQYHKQHKMRLDDPYGAKVKKEVRDAYLVGAFDYFFDDRITPLLRKALVQQEHGQNLHTLLLTGIGGEPSLKVCDRVMRAYKLFNAS